MSGFEEELPGSFTENYATLDSQYTNPQLGELNVNGDFSVFLKVALGVYHFFIFFLSCFSYAATNTFEILVWIGNTTHGIVVFLLFATPVWFMLRYMRKQYLRKQQ